MAVTEPSPGAYVSLEVRSCYKPSRLPLWLARAALLLQHDPNLSRLGWICPLTSLQIFFKVFLFLSENIHYYEKQTLKCSASRSQARGFPSRPKAQPRRAACVCRGYLLAVFCLLGQPANSRSRLGTRSRQGWIRLLNQPSVTGKYTPSPSSRTR